MKADSKKTIGHVIANAAKAYHMATAEALSGMHLYPGQDRLLIILSEQGPLTMRALADALGVQPPTVTKTINRMSQQNLVKRERSITDARQTIVMATDDGLALIKKIKKNWKRVEKQMLKNLDDKEQKTLRKLLKKIS